MRDAINLLVGALIGGAIAHAYYRRSKADFAALRARFDSLQAIVQRAIDDRIIAPVHTSTGDLRALVRYDLGSQTVETTVGKLSPEIKR